MNYTSSTTVTGFAVRKTSTNEITLSSRAWWCETSDTDEMDSQSLNSLERLEEQALSSSYSTRALFNVSRALACLFLTGVFRLRIDGTIHFVYNTIIQRK